LGEYAVDSKQLRMMAIEAAKEVKSKDSRLPSLEGCNRLSFIAGRAGRNELTLAGADVIRYPPALFTTLAPAELYFILVHRSSTSSSLPFTHFTSIVCRIFTVCENLAAGLLVSCYVTLRAYGGNPKPKASRNSFASRQNYSASKGCREQDIRVPGEADRLSTI
jgi:hypothetical protein